APSAKTLLLNSRQAAKVSGAHSLRMVTSVGFGSGRRCSLMARYSSLARRNGVAHVPGPRSRASSTAAPVSVHARSRVHVRTRDITQGHVGQPRTFALGRP